MVFPNERFPNLYGTLFTPESPQTRNYNCIAWAAGDNTRWWWPNDDAYWPDDVPYNESVNAFTELYRLLGYDICNSSGVEEGYTKIAIYAHSANEVTHAAKQIDDGKWASKLGAYIDIYHINLECLTGPEYGDVVVIMKKPLMV